MAKKLLNAALAGLAVLTVLPLVVSDADAKVRRIRDRDVRGAPAPVAGIGLPFVLLMGGYLYWRRRNGSDSQIDSASPKA
jgi:hypothetical protein